MPLPRTTFKTPRPHLELAARLDYVTLLPLRNEDESYGSGSDQRVRLTLSLAVLMAHIEKGLPLVSPRLRGLAEWLRTQQPINPDLLIAPHRLATSAMLQLPRRDVEADIAATHGILDDHNSKGDAHKPILTLLALESLASYGCCAAHCAICARALERAASMAVSQSLAPGVRSYALAVTAALGRAKYHNQIRESLNSILACQSSGGWDKCIVETGYITINLASLLDLDFNEYPYQDIRSAIWSSVEFVQQHCAGGVPEVKFIRRLPEELGEGMCDHKAYAAAVAMRALLQMPRDRSVARLQFTHAAWRLQVERENEHRQRQARSFKRWIGVLVVSDVVLLAVVCWLVVQNQRIPLLWQAVTSTVSAVCAIFQVLGVYRMRK